MKFLERFKDKRNWMIVLGIAGVFFLLVGSYDFSDGKNDTPNSFLYEKYESALEEKLEEFCSYIEGIENIKVFVSLEVSEETVYAQNSSISSAQSTYEYLLFGSDEALPIYEIMPKIRGVAIACDRGSDPYIQKLVTEVISSALGIPTNKIKVVGYG